MLHLNLICLGKLKEKYWQSAEAEYLKRLGGFAKINLSELKEESFSGSEPTELIKTKEAEKIKKELEKFPNTYIVVLHGAGKTFTSEELAHQIDELANRQISDLTFIIGGPLGLHEDILKLADLKLSLSSLTFTHQLARVVLWEQLYRAAMINSGRTYHY